MAAASAQKRAAATRAVRSQPRPQAGPRRAAGQQGSAGPAGPRRRPGPRARPAPVPFTRQPAVRQGAQLAKGNPAHVVMAEFLVAVAIIAMRTVGQYEPRHQGTSRGVIVPSKGALGPLPMLAATLIVFFILALLAVAGGARARVAAVAGLIYDLAMLLNSTGEMAKLTGHLAGIGSGKQSPGGGPGPGMLAYQSVLSGTGAGAQPGSGYPVAPGPGGKCPPHYHLDPSVGQCLPELGQPVSL